MKKKILSLMLVLTVLFSSIGIDSRDICAADGTVKIFLGDDTTPRHHKAIAEGSRSEELSFELKEGTVKKSSYSSDNPNSFKIVKENGKTYIEGIKEDVGYVTLNIETTEGDKYVEKLFISVYKKIGSYRGIINENAKVYRGASTNANVENLDYKGDMQNNTETEVVATCGKFYLIKTLDGSVFADDKDTGFIQKEYVNVLVQKIDVDKQNISIEKAKQVKVSTDIQPLFAKDKNVTWTSKNEKIATVNNQGIISGISEGNAKIQVKAKDKSNTSNIINVSVYSKFKEDYLGYLKNKSILYALAGNEEKVVEINKNTKVELLGECGEYYKVRFENYNGYIIKKIYLYI